ncbi:MAG: hypothetical protein AAB631_01530, partial [Patescibacteria group bacterium]
MAKSDMVRGMLFGVEFLTNVVKEARKLGRTDEEIHEWMKTESDGAKKTAQLIVGTAKNVLRILANLSLADRIARGKYDWVNP